MVFPKDPQFVTGLFLPIGGYTLEGGKVGSLV